MSLLDSRILKLLSPIQKLELLTIPEPNTGCVLWLGGSDKDGYGKMCVNRKHLRVHRIVYELAYGPIPKGMIIQHKCDTPACCNIDHLVLGNFKTNMEDKVKKGRLRNQYMNCKECLNGHDISTPDLYYVSLNSKGRPKRTCKRCHAERQKRYREEKSLI